MVVVVVVGGTGIGAMEEVEVEAKGVDEKGEKEGENAECGEGNDSYAFLSFIKPSYVIIV